MSNNIRWTTHFVGDVLRTGRNGHSGGVLWLTGLPGSGKSTLAMRLEHELFQRGMQVYALDGDNVRQGLNSDLGFSPEDRAENIRRIGEVAALFADAGLIVITAFISPYRAHREQARRACRMPFHEIYLKASLAICEQRDPKGLYRKARRNEITDFTGVSAPYEEPTSPDLVIDTETESIDCCVKRLLDFASSAFVSTKAEVPLNYSV